MRRRTKPRVVWLPSTNSQSVDPANVSSWSIATAPLVAAGAGSTGVIEVPIVMDGVQSDPLGATSSLADIESSGYRLRRIVGKLYCFIAASGDTGSSEEIWGVSAGLIIRRTNPATGGSIAAAASAAAGFDQLNPAQTDNGMDPWIWRRDWLLSNGPDFVGTTTLNAAEAALIQHSGPHFNYGREYAGGNAEGPHVDQKTARIVGPEERLFLDVSATDVIGNGSNTNLVIIYQFRVLASMRQNIGNRRNASR